MAQVFISYASKDQDFVNRLAQDLRQRSVDFWLDQLDIAPDGGPWDDQVEAALTTCHYLLVILSPASVTSQNVKDEIGFALDERKTIITILYQDCKIPLRIRRLQYIDFREDYGKALIILLGVLPALRSPGEVAPASEPKVAPLNVR